MKAGGAAGVVAFAGGLAVLTGAVSIAARLQSTWPLKLIWMVVAVSVLIALTLSLPPIVVLALHVENGVLGLLTLVGVMCVISRRLALRMRSGDRLTIVCAPMFWGVLVTALGTMPFRDLRAMLLLGVYLSVALYWSERRQGSQAAATGSAGRPMASTTGVLLAATDTHHANGANA